MSENPPAALAVIPPVSTADFADPGWIGPFAQDLERLGFESLVLPEHVVLAVDYTSRYPYSKSGRVPLPHDCVIPDPLDTLAYVAGVTTTLGLATGLLVLPMHNPLMLAKRAATVDRLSGGRLRLGVGLGWLREEIEAGGVDFASRGARADEAIDAIRALWRADPETGARFDGRHFSFSGVQSFPRPVRAGGVPIEVGGTTRVAIRRAATRGDGWLSLGLRGDDLAAALRLLTDEATAAGRDATTVEVTLSGVTAPATVDRAVLEQAAAFGARRVVLNLGSATLAEAQEELRQIAERAELTPPR
ncbi:MAG TPA: LLM class F420-dependent oxidoreductase [Acidimicrobiales bacterium]|nr:LLM class F420-dependent oxidoreductase [Acidimicrobiales bacterium]